MESGSDTVQISIHGSLRNVLVVKKRGNKRTYMRVKEDGTIYVTTNIWTSDKEVLRTLKEYEDSIWKMISEQEKKKEEEEKFYYLGKEYAVVRTNSSDIYLGEEKVYIGENTNVDKWYLEMAKPMFLERLNYWYEQFHYKIPYPSLKIGYFKSKWGSCQIKKHVVSLNLSLIRKDPICLDYVIVHELSHLVYPNHSIDFWRVVEEHMKDYKKIRKYLKK